MISIPIGHTGKLANFLLRIRRWVILAMLLSLHAGLIAEPGSDYARIWLLVHFGLFLLWQPFVATDQEIQVVSVLLIFAITAVTLYFLSGWMLVGWLAILIGILGGKVFTQQANRRSRFYLIAVFYLFAVLLIWAIPVLQLRVAEVPESTRILVMIVLPLPLFAMVFLPFSGEDESTTQVFDFFYSLMVFQLVVTLSLGSIAVMLITKNEYYPALMITVLGFALALIVLAVLWGPRTGFGGLRTYFSHYLMSVGMPFELWMRRVAELAEADISSTRFLQAAMTEISKMPWIMGGAWKSPDGEGSFGVQRGFDVKFVYHDLETVFFTEIRLSPALFLHVRLLAQVVGEFYEGKRREQVLRQSAYMQAVHETGARLTHDIKNLLQSLFALTSGSVLNQEEESSGAHSHAQSAHDRMLERHLPQLTKRLQATLDKLQNPALNTRGISVPASEWWKDVLARYRDGEMFFSATLDKNPAVPATLFDAVLENCLENARKKKQLEPEIKITVRLWNEGDLPLLSITDTGSAVSEEAIGELFQAPVMQARYGGLGIGLFQASRQAIQAGYLLSLAENSAGCVSFELRPAKSGQQRLAL
jgi:Histidine kinase-, DNA gyrase B-, and HSP90-like ATPase